jgi:hypothetical protein
MMASHAYFRIGGWVWKAKYAKRFINFFSFPINQEFTSGVYNENVKTYPMRVEMQSFTLHFVRLSLS